MFVVAMCAEFPITIVIATVVASTSWCFFTLFSFDELYVRTLTYKVIKVLFCGRR